MEYPEESVNLPQLYAYSLKSRNWTNHDKSRNWTNHDKSRKSITRNYEKSREIKRNKEKSRKSRKSRFSFRCLW